MGRDFGRMPRERLELAHIGACGREIAVGEFHTRFQRFPDARGAFAHRLDDLTGAVHQHHALRDGGAAARCQSVEAVLVGVGVNSTAYYRLVFSRFRGDHQVKRCEESLGGGHERS